MSSSESELEAPPAKKRCSSHSSIIHRISSRQSQKAQVSRRAVLFQCVVVMQNVHCVHVWNSSGQAECIYYAAQYYTSVLYRYIGNSLVNLNFLSWSILTSKGMRFNCIHKGKNNIKSPTPNVARTPTSMSQTGHDPSPSTCTSKI